MDLDTLNSASHFSNVAMAARPLPKKKEDQKVRKKQFTSQVERYKEIYSLKTAGLPEELVDMDIEEAIVYLKDEIDKASDRFEEAQTGPNFASFRESVSHLLKYVERENYKVYKRNRVGRFANGKHIHKGVSPFFWEKKESEPHTQIAAINDRLNEIAAMIMSEHGDKMKMLTKTGEIKGLIVSLLA